MYLTIDDAKYWYNVQVEGVPVVLLHGFTGSAAAWDSITKQWEGMQVITIDLPGHGKTVTESPRSMQACCRDLRALLTCLQLPEVHLAGYSMGGRTALSFAMYYPELVKSLILESASPGLETAAERKERVKADGALAGKIEQEGIAAFVRFWENIPLFATQKKLSATIREKVRNGRMQQSEAGLAASLRFMGTGSQPSWWEQLHQFTRPVLLLAGEEDKKYVGINQKMDKLLQTSELICVKNTGHAIHVEEPEIFGKLVYEYIFKHT